MEFIESAHHEAFQTISTQELPGWEEACVPEEKLTKYALNPTSEDGRHKARMFKAQLGIELKHWRFLRDQLLEGFPEAQATFHRESEYGLQWEVPILVAGCNETVRWVTTGWIVQYRDPRPRLTSAYPEHSRRNKELRQLDGLVSYAPMARPEAAAALVLPDVPLAA